MYDPTNYQNALLRYYQLQQHLLQLQKSYAKITSQLELAMQMATFIQKHARSLPRSVFAMAQRDLAQHLRKHRLVDQRHQLRPTSQHQHRLPTSPQPNCSRTARTISPGWMPSELGRVQSQYASVQLVDGANINAMATIGSIRGSAQDIQTQIGNLEQDSFSSDSDLNSEVSVLNKINAAGVLTLRTLQDSNKLLASLLEKQTILAKQQREATTNTINADIQRQASLAANMAQVTGTLTNSLQNFRMP